MFDDLTQNSMDFDPEIELDDELEGILAIEEIDIGDEEDNNKSQLIAKPNKEYDRKQYYDNSNKQKYSNTTASSYQNQKSASQSKILTRTYKLFDKKVVKMKKEVEKSTAGGIDFWLVITPQLGRVKSKKMINISPSVSIYFGVYKGQIQNNGKILPTFDWNEENKYWFSDYDQVYQFYKLLVELIKTESQEPKKFSNPGKKKDIELKRVGDIIMFSFYRISEDSQKVRAYFTLTLEEAKIVAEYISQVLKVIPEYSVKAAIDFFIARDFRL